MYDGKDRQANSDYYEAAWKSRNDTSLPSKRLRSYYTKRQKGVYEAVEKKLPSVFNGENAIKIYFI